VRRSIVLTSFQALQCTQQRQNAPFCRGMRWVAPSATAEDKTARRSAWAQGLMRAPLAAQRVVTRACRRALRPDDLQQFPTHAPCMHCLAQAVVFHLLRVKSGNMRLRKHACAASDFRPRGHNLPYGQVKCSQSGDQPRPKVFRHQLHRPVFPENGNGPRPLACEQPIHGALAR
jgi:hypothetical protein